MTLKSWAVRGVRIAVGSATCLLLAALLVVPIQQRLFRSRAERLLADMHQIRLHQSSWSDAQRLMRRWGAWGHYEGDCTAQSCDYTISLSDLGYGDRRVPRTAWLDWLFVHDRFHLYYWLGGRPATFYAGFTVHDGAIWREASGMAILVATRRMRQEDEFDKALMFETKSRQRLRRTNTDSDQWWILGQDDQLSRHPFYKASRPGGCKIDCQLAVVTYSPYTPQAEIERLTSFDFSCLTRFTPCAELEQVLPAAREWNLYGEHGDDLPSDAAGSAPCDIPVWALARDARYVLVVEALDTKSEMDHDWRREATQVRILDSLKSPAPWAAGALVKAYPFGGSTSPPLQQTEHLARGRRFIVFPIGDDRRDRVLSKDSPITLERCGVQEDTPAIRAEIGKGFAQNDGLDP